VRKRTTVVGISDVVEVVLVSVVVVAFADVGGNVDVVPASTKIFTLAKTFGQRRIEKVKK